MCISEDIEEGVFIVDIKLNKVQGYTQSQKKHTVVFLLQRSEDRYDPAGVTWPWPWVPGEANKFMVHFFWDWVYKEYLKITLCQFFSLRSWPCWQWNWFDNPSRWIGHKMFETCNPPHDMQYVVWEQLRGSYMSKARSNAWNKIRTLGWLYSHELDSYNENYIMKIKCAR